MRPASGPPALTGKIPSGSLRDVKRLSILLVTSALFVSIVTPAQAARGYYRLSVPEQSAIGCVDDATGIGRIAPTKLIAVGGRLTSKMPHYRWTLLGITPGNAADFRIDPATGVLHGAGPNIPKGSVQVRGSVKDTRSTVKFNVHLDVSAGNSNPDDGFPSPCPEVAFVEYNNNRTGYVPAGRANYEYGVSLFAVGGVPKYTFNLTSGKLPKGLHFESRYGVIWGTPTQSGKFPLQVKIVDNSGLSARMQMQLVIAR